MAGGKMSPRQKMIGLMYLVLLALLALQVSSEVMEAFSNIYENAESTISQSKKKNDFKLKELKGLSEENSKQYGKVYKIAKDLVSASKKFINEINVLQGVIISNHPKDPLTGKFPSRDMAKSDLVDQFLFLGDKNNIGGDRFLSQVDSYRKRMNELLKGNDILIEQVDSNFDSKPILIEGVKKNWLDRTFKGLPSIGTLAILANMESAVLNIEHEALSLFLSGRLKQATSAINLKALLVPTKKVFFQGEEFKADILLASKDDSRVPNKFEINGKEINLNNPKVFSKGVILLSLPLGKLGKNEIKGSLTFLENKKKIEIPVFGDYFVDTKPGAVVSAEKMNVLYRGIDNPVNIIMAGISPANIVASAPGLRKIKGSSYFIKPTTGNTVSIEVSGKTDFGEVIKSKSVIFRIKNIPNPIGRIRGKYSSIRLPKSGLEKIIVEAGLPDFDFDLQLQVVGFKVKVPGRTTVIVQGREMSSEAKKALNQAKRDDIITIFDIKTTVKGSSLKIGDVLPVSVEVSN